MAEKRGSRLSGPLRLRIFNITEGYGGVVWSYSAKYFIPFKEHFHSGELSNETVIKEILIPAQNGVRGLSEGKIKYYNLDVIISVGYRVNSILATNFRIWATKVLKEYMIKGFVLDDERLKKGGNIFGKEYFDELLERVQEIRASERLFYQKLTDIFAESVDYDRNSQICRDFYASVQNKL